MNSTTTNTWYADGLRWVASIFSSAADYLERPSMTASLSPMPRHISYDEVVGDVRNRINSGFGAGQRSHY